MIEKDACYLDNIGSGNGLLPDSTKPLPDPMLNNETASFSSGLKVCYKSLKKSDWIYFLNAGTKPQQVNTKILSDRYWDSYYKK